MPRIKRLLQQFPPWVGVIAAFGAGCAAALGHAPWSLWPVSLLGFIGICVLHLRAENTQKAAWLGWLSGTGYFGVSLFWIVEPFLVDIAKHGWMAPFALFLMAAGLALLWAAPAAISSRVPSVFLRSIAFAVSLTLFEMLRSILFTGFPWALPAYIWSNHSLMQLSAWVGSFGLTLFTLLISVLIAFSITARRPIAAVISSVFFAFAWVIAGSQIPNADAATTGKLARLLQPNAAQHLKWQREMIPVFFSSQLDMTRSASAAGIDLVVWPEMAVGYRLNQTPEALRMIAEAAGGVPVAFGGNSVIDDKFRNSMALMNSGGDISDWYYKHHLVPFGEYVPLGDLLGQIGIRGLAARDGAGYDVGDGPQVFDVEGVGKVLPLICYELIFPRHLRTDVRPDIILQITNDAWFGNVSGPYQHLAQAKFRAVEQGLPVLRSANTGISAAIDPYGRIIAQLALNEKGFLDVPIPSPLAPTFYSQTGDTPLFIILMLVMAGIMGRSALGRRHV
jgi:apolipoprotein N-acyltransferase